MVNIEQLDPEKFILKTAEKLKSVKEIQIPEWADFVKTGAGKTRMPEEKDWWYQRTASILRKIELLGPIGVQKLRTVYGNKKNRGYKPERFYKAGGSIIRKILQQLESAGFIEQTKIKGPREQTEKNKEVVKGRVTTQKGRLFIKEIAKEITK